MFLKTVFRAEIPIIATEYYGVPSVETTKLMTIIEVKLEQMVELVKMRNCFLNYLRYRDSNQILIDIDCNHIIGSFD